MGGDRRRRRMKTKISWYFVSTKCFTYKYTKESTIIILFFFLMSAIKFKRNK